MGKSYLTGFGLLFDLAREVAIAEGVRTPVPPVSLAVFCKFLSFRDRGSPKDLADAAYMLAHYEEALVSEMRFESSIPEELPYEMRGAYLAGKDLGRMIPPEASDLLRPLLISLQRLPGSVMLEAIRASRISRAEFNGLLDTFGAGLGLTSS